jgi:ABC-type sugar transport system substrate-binding protein
MAQFLRRDAALKKCALRVVSPENNVPMSPEQLASAIRTAANRSTGAVILEPIDAPEVRDALREAEAKALPIVLLDAPLPSSSPGKPYPYVTYRGFVDAGKKLVEVLADDAGLLRLPPDGTTLVIENRDKDLYSRQRLESITSALKTASRAYEVVSFEGGLKGAFEIVTEYLKAHPKVTMILADHEFGVAGAYDARAQWKESGKHEVILGGYAACDVRLDQIVKALAEGLANRNVEGYARKAFQVAIDLMDGKPAPERAEVEIRVIHNPPQYQPVSDETKELIPPGGPAPASREPAQPPSSSSEPREKP